MGYVGSNQEAYDMFGLSIRSRHGKPPDVPTRFGLRGFFSLVTRNWEVHYSEYKRWIEASDEAAQLLLAERNRQRNAPFAELPFTGIPDDQIPAAERSIAQRRGHFCDVGSLRQLPSYAPSLIRLWTEAKQQGMSNDEAFLYVHRSMSPWAPCWDRDEERKRQGLPKIDAKVTRRLRQVTVWRKTGDLDVPWDAEVKGQLWQVRLNDFPLAYMYTLIIGGEVIGDFNNWPGAWDRGERKPRKEPAPLGPRATIQVDASTLLPRYQGGECEGVWRDLVALGADVRQPAYRDAAWAVAEETMRRARQNVELIVERLKKLGYRFHESRSVLIPASAKKRKLIERAERSGLWLPISLRACLEVMGEVDLNGSHPALCFMDTEEGNPGIYADPLQVTFWQLDEAVHDWAEADGEDRDPVELIVSMNARDKAGRGLDWEAEGGYVVRIPNGVADAMLEGAPGGGTFVEYLRRSFQWGGFPGWERYEQRPEELAGLRTGLVAI